MNLSVDEENNILLKAWLKGTVAGNTLKNIFLNIMTLSKERRKGCPKCGGKVKMHNIDFIGTIEYNVYRCVDCETEYI
jgi:DNA-directed RNA polymerase subunit RPC12/RpoP